MARGRLAFKETDVARAIRGAQRAGLTDYRIEISRAGAIVILPGGGLPSQVEPPAPPPSPEAELDAELARWRAENGEG